MGKLGRWYAAAAVIAVGLLALALVLTWGPPEARAMVRDVGAWVAAAVAPLLTALLTRDADGDGTPDVLQGGASALLAVVLAGTLAQGCGSTARDHHVRLNALTAVADPTYALAVETCDEARDLIVAREGSTEEADRRDMAAVVLVCDSIVEGFEALRGSQITARAAIDHGLAGAAEALILQGLASWQELRTLVPRIIAATTSGGER